MFQTDKSFLSFRQTIRITALLLAVIGLTSTAFAQNFITGADLSYTNTILNNGGEYRNSEGIVVDPFTLFAQQGAKMVRLRLWHTPENIQDYCGNPITSSGLNDVLLAAEKIHDQGMGLNLTIHYGDYFNDPGKQLRPGAWAGLSHQILLDSIYQYTYHVLARLYEQNTPPEIVSIGNETTNGFIDETATTNGFSWPEDADKFNAGLDAVDDFNEDHNLNILKAIHLTENTAKWATGLFINQGITNFDVIGVSYYPYFSPGTNLDDIGNLIKDLVADYGKTVMLFETGFIWTTANADNYNNFIGNNGNVVNYPVSAQGQRDFLMDLSQVVSDNGGTGIFYWEAGWISSSMCDKWGRGSSYENAGFFDFTVQNKPLPAFEFFQFEDTLAINHHHFEQQIEVLPNPFTQRASVFYTLDQPVMVTLTVYDQAGNEIATLSQHQSKGKQQITWNAGEFAPGIYFFRLRAAKKLAYGKLIKV